MDYFKKKTFLITIYAILMMLIAFIIKDARKITKITPDLEYSNKFSCQFKNNTRYFYLFLPEQEDLSQTSMVIMLHGYGSSAQSFINQTSFEQDALPRNYAVLYISGIANPKIKMSSPGFNYNYNREGKLDFEFITEITKYIRKNYSIRGQTYMVGFSNGAFMANKLALESPDTFGTVVSVGGMVPSPVFSRAASRKKTMPAFFQINGTKDPVVPMIYNGTDKNREEPSTEKVISFLMGTDPSDLNPQKEQLSEKVTLLKYDSKVWWMLIDDYTHSWPSESYCKLNVNQIILDFFDQIEPNKKGE